MAAARERHLNLTQKAKALGEDARTAEFEATQLEAGGLLQLNHQQASGDGITQCPCVRQRPFINLPPPRRDLCVTLSLLGI